MFRKLFCVCLTLISIFGCQEEEPISPSSPAQSPVDISGYVQKGPFINGTTLIISELDDSLAATGKTFTTQITDNRGSFFIKTSQLDYTNLQLIATGFYYDEVKGEKSAAQLTLYALADVSTDARINVNILSHLEKDRVLYLLNQGVDFLEAKAQAQSEILAIFGIEKENMQHSELLDISQAGEDNAILLAISAILQGDNAVAQLSELLADISTDLREDGIINSDKIKDALKHNSINLDLPAIRQHLVERYAELGVEASIANFEQYVDSDGDGILNKDDDNTPDEFVFVSQDHVEINTYVISNEIVISDISTNGFITATIQNGELIKNGEILQDSVVNLVNGDRIKIKVISSEGYNEPVTASMKFGEAEKHFVVTTDTYTPDGFNFNTVESAVKNTNYTSDNIEISGLKYPTPTTIVGGILLKNGIELKVDSTTVTNGDILAIKTTSHSEWQGKIQASLTVGSVGKSFEIINKNNLWIRKAKFPGEGAYGQVSFTLNGKIYVGSGRRKTFGATNEFYEFDPAQNSWKKVANFKGVARENAIVFTLNGKAYIGLGNSIDGGGGYEKTLKDFWEYDPDKNVWNQINDFPGKSRTSASCFIVNGNTYVGLGFEWNYGEYPHNDFWKFEASTKSWSRVADFPGGKRYGSVSFSFESEGYIIGGVDSRYIHKKDIWSYDPSINYWRRKKDNIIETSTYGIAFTIGNNTYIGTGSPNFAGEGYFYQYEPQTENWILLDGYTIRAQATVSTFDKKEYYFRGNEVWEYTP